MPRKIGFHASISGGPHKALLAARDLGCSAVQIFSTSPRRALSAKQASLKEIDSWETTKGAIPAIFPILHFSYLINPVNPKTFSNGLSTQEALTFEFKRAVQLGVDQIILHPGSTKDTPLAFVETLSSTLGYSLSESGYQGQILLENQSGAGNQICANPSILTQVVDRLRKQFRANNIGVCLDTCHLFSAGYDLRTSIDLLQIAHDLPVDLVHVIHLNDAKNEVGKPERHEEIGKGKIGLEALAQIIKIFPDATLISETPACLDIPKMSQELELIRRISS